MNNIERKISAFLVGEKGSRTRGENPEVFTSEKIGEYVVVILEGGWDGNKFIKEGIECLTGVGLERLKIGTTVIM